MKMRLFLFIVTLIILCSCSNPSSNKLFHLTLPTLAGENFNLEVIKEYDYTAIFFLFPDCPLCINYTSVINKISQKINKEKLYINNGNIICIIPSKNYLEKEISKYVQKYKLDYPILLDKNNVLSNLLNATVVPEVFLLNNKGDIQYHGAIDNWVISLGQNRQKTTEHYLINAIDDLNNNNKISVAYKKPIGCIIEP